MFKAIITTLHTVALVVGLAGMASAQSGPEPRLRDQLSTPQSTATLYSELAQVAADQPFWLALTIDPADGWHSYWRNPGDSGEAPTLRWSGVEAEEPYFPTPSRLPVGPLVNYGFEGSSTLLIQARVPDGFGGSILPVTLDAQWLICDVECIPQSGKFTVMLPVGQSLPATDAMDIFAEARAGLPDPSPWAADLVLKAERAALSLATGTDLSGKVVSAAFFPAQDGLIDYAGPQDVDFSEDALTLTMPRVDQPVSANRFSGVVKLTTSEGQVRAFTVDGPLTVAAASTVSQARTKTAADARVPALETPQIGAGTAVLFAVIGGLLLNLMPCVFPVLFIKAMSLIKAAAAGERSARADGLAYSAGILTSFWLLAGIMIVMKSLDAPVGWGFQLQEPLVIAVLAIVLFAVALSFFGVLEVGGRLAGLGQSLAQGQGRSASYFTGVLAVVVATPCTAPFMATAVGFAATQSAPVSLSVFTGLAVGLALPYLLITFVPALRHRLPKPGAWMETLKQALGFPILLTVVWLLWVLGTQGGSNAVALVLVALTAVAFISWLGQRLHGRGRVAILAGWVLVIAGGAGFAAAWQSFVPNFRETMIAAADAGTWSPEAVDEALAQGQPVFVNFTADWCITCLVNQRVVLSRDGIKQMLADNNVKVLVADWTNKNEAIREELERFGRNGVPLYLFYPRQGAAPEVFPAVLTPEGFTDRIEQALTPRRASSKQSDDPAGR